MLLIVADSYHLRGPISTPNDAGFDIEPEAFHLILRNHTYCQLLRRHDLAQRQIKTLLNDSPPRSHSVSSASSSVSSSIETADFLGVLPASDPNLIGTPNGRTRRGSAPVRNGPTLIEYRSKRRSLRRSDDDNIGGPRGRFWKVSADSLSPFKRRRHSVEHPVFVPRLR